MKNSLITGATSGIGRVIALALARQETNLIITGTAQNKLQNLKKEIEEAGGRAELIVSDLTRSESVDQLINDVKNQINALDIFIHTAGIWHGERAAFANTDFQDFDLPVVMNTIQVGLVSAVKLVHQLLPLMPIKGKILTISGTFEDGAKGWLPYYLSKRALEDFTIGLAQELEKKDIQSNCISPSDTATEAYLRFFPEYEKDAQSPGEVAKLALHLCSNKADNISGKVFVLKKNQQPKEGFHN